ncbi:MAG: hypothetical protein GX836_02425 [Spirochaetales bacterium]|nr:hypothetical protein [Spirochaetales bacterium]
MAYNTIKVKKYSDVIEEKVASAAITPGMLLIIENTGKVKAHDQVDKDVFPIFALEDELQGKGIDDAYAANDPVQCWIPYRGDIVNAILADGETVVIGDALTSDGEGRLKKHVTDTGSSTVPWTVYPEQIVGYAAEALDLSGSSGAEVSGPLGYHKRLLVRIA